MNLNIAVLPGDGIGPEITNQSVKVLKAVAQKYNHDFKFAQEQAKKVNNNAILYLQPEWGKREKMMPLMVEFVKNNPKWRISLQSHKYLNIP